MPAKSPTYYHDYYQRNKERIAKRNHELYLQRIADPTQRELLKKRCAEASKRWRQHHIEQAKQTRKQAELKRRIRAMELLGGAICKRCGCTEITFLEINHKNGGGAKEQRHFKQSLTDIILKGDRSTEDLEVLCRVCNALDYLEHKNLAMANRFTITWK